MGDSMENNVITKGESTILETCTTLNLLVTMVYGSLLMFTSSNVFFLIMGIVWLVVQTMRTRIHIRIFRDGPISSFRNVMEAKLFKEEVVLAGLYSAMVIVVGLIFIPGWWKLVVIIPIFWISRIIRLSFNIDKSITYLIKKEAEESSNDKTTG